MRTRLEHLFSRIPSTPGINISFDQHKTSFCLAFYQFQASRNHSININRHYFTICPSIIGFIFWFHQHWASKSHITNRRRHFIPTTLGDNALFHQYLVFISTHQNEASLSHYLSRCKVSFGLPMTNSFICHCIGKKILSWHFSCPIYFIRIFFSHCDPTEHRIQNIPFKTFFTT